MNRVIIGSAAIVALVVSLSGCGRTPEPRAPEAASIARALNAHGIECTTFEAQQWLVDETNAATVGQCETDGLTLDINTFRSVARRRLFEQMHEGLCPIAAARDDPVSILPYARGERWIVSVRNEVVTPDDRDADAWRSLAPRVARALGGTVATVDCPALNS